tara:strand:+ start:125 stop:457 length:333 start_codon:yes stop_codon:yes gene_type:complete
LTLTNYEKDYCKQKFINLLGVRQDFLYLYQKLGVSYQIQIILSKKLIAYTGESPSQFKLPSEKCVESIFIALLVSYLILNDNEQSVLFLQIPKKRLSALLIHPALVLARK